MKTAFLSVILSLGLGGGYFLFEKTTPPVSAQTGSSVSPTPDSLNAVFGDFRVYSILLTHLAYNEPFGRSGGDWLSVKRETIIPADLESIGSLPDLPEEVINDFIDKNRSSEKLYGGNDFGVKYAHDIVDQRGELESFFKSKKKKQPRLEAIVGLSKLGSNKERTRFLVYVEYFDLEKKLQKKYCLITFTPRPGGFFDTNFKWF
jgi:hypothetical protein